MANLTYAKAGVDIPKENRAISALVAKLTYKRKGLGAPLTDIGHYAGLIDFGEYALGLTIDGVGSKVLIANEMERWNTIGIDCIAMNVNDLLAMGIEPLALVDYIAINHPDEEIMAQIGEGLAKGAEQARITIVGGETATLPDLIKAYEGGLRHPFESSSHTGVEGREPPLPSRLRLGPRDEGTRAPPGSRTLLGPRDPVGLDLAGACLGMVKKSKVIAGEHIELGDIILGLPSTGVHSNGYTLVRRIIEKSKYRYQDPFPYNPEKTIGEELLTPTRIYMEILDLVRECEVHGLAHITGGGLLKLRRITHLGFRIDRPLKPQDIFKFQQEEGGVEDLEMYKTFNMGMGFAVILPKREVKKAIKLVNGRVVGEIVEQGIRVGDLEIA